MLFSKSCYPRLFFAGLLTALPTIAFAADPGPAPGEWRLSPYLTGSTDRIRDLINGPLESVLNRRAFKLQQLNTLKADIDRKAAALMKSSPDYLKLQSDLTTDQARLAAARDQQDAVALISAQNKVESDQSELRSLFSATINTDPRLAPAKKQIEDSADELKQLDPAVTSASKARDQLMGGLRTSLRLLGPPAAGSKGILDKVKATKIIDAQSFVCDFDAYEIQGEDKDAKVADGFKALTAISHRVHLLVTGYDTSKLHAGTSIQLDETFQITGEKTVGKFDCYVVEPNESDPRDKAFDGLFRVLDTLRVPDSVKPM